MSSSPLTVVVQNFNSIPQFNRAASVGTCSPTTTDAVGNAPLVDLVYDYFAFTIIRFSGRFDNSSITSFTLTPSGGSTLTFNVNNYNYYSNDNSTQWGSTDSYRNLVAGTTYTLRIYSGSTNVNTEGVTLERRNPKDMSDFYGATRNVPPVSGAFKLSWLKNAVKYDHGSTLTAGFFYDSFNGYNYHGYGSIYPSMGSLTNTTISDIINFYNGKLIINLYNLNTNGVNYVTLTIKTTAGSASTPLGVNSQWYKLKIGSASFYREDATFGANTNSPYFTSFTWNTGSTQYISTGNTYAVELIC
jgi:hypothetical protein